MPPFGAVFDTAAKVATLYPNVCVIGTDVGANFIVSSFS